MLLHVQAPNFAPMLLHVQAWASSRCVILLLTGCLMLADFEAACSCNCGKKQMRKAFHAI